MAASLRAATGRFYNSACRKLEQNRVAHEAVDRRGTGHLVAEGPVLLAEDEIARAHHRAAPVAAATG